MTLEEAHRHCRDVARAEARNFYYGFILLPERKRSGIYAAYAFSRRADDAADGDEPPEERLAAVGALRGQLDAAVAGDPPPGDPVLVALADAIRTFRIPREHFEALIEGVEMDLVNRVVQREGCRIPLTAKEFALLEYFMRHPNRLLTRTAIGEHVWDMNFEPESNVIDVYVSMLRRRIDKAFDRKLIHTVIGAGYMFSAEPPGA